MAEVDFASEVADRSADGSDGSVYIKVFVVSGGGDYLNPDNPIHIDNAAGVSQEAINRGLRPKGVARLRDAKVVDHDRRSGQDTIELSYGVECVPAWADDHNEATVTPSDIVEATKPNDVQTANADVHADDVPATKVLDEAEKTIAEATPPKVEQPVSTALPTAEPSEPEAAPAEKPAPVAEKPAETPVKTESAPAKAEVKDEPKTDVKAEPAPAQDEPKAEAK
jgi:hypothetical protein